MNPFGDIKRVAFVSTRIAGTDGVSLEIAKWAEILRRMGMECLYIAGECDREEDRSVIIEEAHFNHPVIDSINRRALGHEVRTPALTDDIYEAARRIRNRLNQVLGDLRIDGIIVENALTIPMNVPLGVALVHSVMETGIGCLAHHHDFYWERKRYLINAIDDIIHCAFPPLLPQIQHVVINSLASEEFSRRTGMSCRIVPNVMDFDRPPPEPDTYARGFRQEVGVAEDEWLILQPTRVVARKGIEHSIELVKRLQPERAKLVITHAGGDEGEAYPSRVREFAEMAGVEVVFAQGRIAQERGTDGRGRRLFTMADAYSQADLVSYPSEYEGFGNAFVEAVYYRQPVVCNRYTIYQSDIEPLGFQVVLFDGFLTPETVKETRHVLEDRAYRRRMVEYNFELGRQFFSYGVVEDELRAMMNHPQNLYRVLSRNRPPSCSQPAGGD